MGDAGRWADVVVEDRGSSLLTVLILSVKKYVVISPVPEPVVGTVPLGNERIRTMASEPWAKGVYYWRTEVTYSLGSPFLPKWTNKSNTVSLYEPRLLVPPRRKRHRCSVEVFGI